MPDLLGPAIGPTLGLQSGQKDRPRVDFREGEFIKQIETHGVRLAWSRSSICPCAPANDQTKQSNPNCSLCHGEGFLFFRPSEYVAPDDVGEMDPTQQRILLDYKAVVIRGVMVSAMRQENAFDILGQWVLGSVMITTRPENRLGYFDRLVALDAMLPYSQLAFSKSVTSGSTTVHRASLRYPAVQVNLCRSEAQEFKADVDFQITDAGDLEFLPLRNPPPDTRLAVHYDHRPVFIVWEHTHAFRDSLKAFKQTVKKTPLGNPQQLPIQSLARLEFLPFPRSEA